MPSPWPQSVQEEIVLEYFADDSGHPPQCPDCGETLEIQSRVAGPFGLQVEVRCAPCSRVFTWSQPQPDRPWKELYLRYFAERYLGEEPLRCPFDDAFVTYAEFEEGQVVQFNCPYCNRRGRILLERTPPVE